MELISLCFIVKVVCHTKIAITLPEPKRLTDRPDVHLSKPGIAIRCGEGLVE